jgi:hypothetical protein
MTSDVSAVGADVCYQAPRGAEREHALHSLPLQHGTHKAAKHMFENSFSAGIQPHSSVQTSSSRNRHEQIQSAHHVSLQSPTGQCFLGKQSLFTVRAIRNTHAMLCVGQVQCFSMLRLVVRVVTTAL